MKRYQLAAALAMTSLIAVPLALTAGAGAATAPYSETENLAGDELADALSLPRMTWEAPTDGVEPILVTRDGEENLASCGSGEQPDTMLVLGSGGTAYCLQGIDMHDPQAVLEARSIAERLVRGRALSDIELEILRLKVELSFLDPNSPETIPLREQLDSLYAALEG